MIYKSLLCLFLYQINKIAKNQILIVDANIKVMIILYKMNYKIFYQIVDYFLNLVYDYFKTN